MDVAQFGCFDTANYGDLMLPLIARDRLPGHRLTALAPEGRVVLRWPDAVASIAAERALQEGFRCDACLIGGGDLIRVDAAGHDTDAADDLMRHVAMPSLWLGAGLVAAGTGARLIWNAPGVPGSVIGRDLRPFVAALLAASDYVAVRDPSSLARLRTCAEGTGTAPERMSVVPDTIVDVARLWPRKSLTERFEALFVRRGKPIPARTLVVHIDDRSGIPAADLVGPVTRLAETTGSLPILLAGDTDGNDGVVARAVAASLAIPHLLLDRPSALRDVAACLALSAGYVGSDRSAFLTSLAYGNGGLLIAGPTTPWAGDLISQYQLSDIRCRDWAEAAERIAEAIAGDAARRAEALRATQASLDTHWARIEAVLAAPPDPARQTLRHAYARAVADDNAASTAWIARLGGIVAREAARMRATPVANLLELDLLLVQGRPDHVGRRDARLLVHPPSLGLTEAALDPIPLRAGDRLSGAATVAHPDGRPVRFGLMLVDRNGRMLGRTELVAEAGQLAPWRMTVPADAEGTGSLLIATSMASAEDNNRFAWAELISPVLAPATSAAQDQDGGANTSGAASQETPGSSQSVAMSVSSNDQASSPIAR